MDRFQHLLREQSLERRYNPDWRLQPRVPRGDPDGGQWTRGPDGVGGDGRVPNDTDTRDGRRPSRRLAPATPAATGPVGLTDPRVISDANPVNDWELGEQYAQARSAGGGARSGGGRGGGSAGGGLYRIGNRFLEATPGEALRLDFSNAQRDFAIARVRGVDPAWHPRPMLTRPNAIEEHLRRNEEVIAEANARYQQIQRWHNDLEIIELLSRAVGPAPEPTVPPERPATMREANVVVKELSYWLADPVTFDAVDRVLGVGSWLFDFRHYITAYLQPPRTLDELRAAGRQPQPGFDRHHFVEKASAREDNFPESWIEGDDNILGIPTLKHWLLNAWYQTPQSAFGWMSPREYLRGRSWEERERVGRIGLVKVGVLKP
jgi:hypothetical protein